MVGFKYGNSSKHLNEEYQATRRKAERTSFSIEEFSDIEITKFDLEELNLGGLHNPRTYEINKFPVKGETDKTYNLAELDTR